MLNRLLISFLFITKTTMSKLIFAFSVVFHLICGAYTIPIQDLELPQNIKVCNKNENYYSTCLANAIQDSWPVFVKGIPELNSPPLEPYKIDRIERYLYAGQFVGSVILNNVTFYGLADTKFISVQPHFTDNRMTLDMYVKIPKVVIECDYKTQGNVESISIGGKGHFNVSMNNLSAKWVLDGYLKNDRWLVKHFWVADPKIKGMKVYFSDLFNGNQILNNAALIIVNDSWPIFFNAMKPIIVQLSDGYLANFVNSILFSKVAISKIFP